MHKKYLWVIIILIIISLVLIFLNNEDSKRAPEQNNVACTLEAKICPDGTAVGRVGPSCEFAKCPGE